MLIKLAGVRGETTWRRRSSKRPKPAEIYQCRKPRPQRQITATGRDILSRELLIINKRGLHARASAKFVQMVEGFDAAITVSKDGMTVGGTSIMGLMMLAASPGCSSSSPPAAARPGGARCARCS
jgi:phosphotransferase system HPr (HPr) family protein